MALNRHTMLVDQIDRWLKFHVKDGLFWKNATGTAYRGTTPIAYGKKGSGDILGCYRGRFIAIEAKTGRGVQSPAQIEFEKRVRACGGIYTVARSVADVQDCLASLTPLGEK